MLCYGKREHTRDIPEAEGEMAGTPRRQWYSSTVWTLKPPSRKERKASAKES